MAEGSPLRIEVTKEKEVRGMAEIGFMMLMLALSIVAVYAAAAAAELARPGSVRRLEERIGFGGEPEWARQAKK